MIVLLTGAGAAALFAHGPFDLAPMAARRASNALGRPLAIATLRVHPGAVFAVEMRDLVLDNAQGGSQPRMFQVARLDAEVGPWPFLLWILTNRVPVLRQLSIDGVKLLLEHGPDDKPNWHVGDAGAPSNINRRAEFPTLLDARLHNVEIDLRTSSGRMLRISLADATIAADGAASPITVSGTGAYNTVPIRLAAALRSFHELHDAVAPFGMELHFSSGDTTLDFIGTMTDPLNSDGADGRLALNAPNWDRLLAIAGLSERLELPVKLAGAVTRQGDLWRLTGGSGTLRGHPFQGSFQIREGARRAPDDMTVDAGFSVLDFTRLPATEKPGEMTLRIDAEPGTLLDAHITAKQFLYGALRAEDIDLKAKLAPGVLAVEPLALHLAGGTARIDAEVRNTKTSAAVQFDGALTGAGANQLAGLLGVGSIPLTGAIDAHTHLRLTGTTLTELGRSNRGVVILSMQGGSIERKIVEGASTDLRLLFRAPEGTARIACLLGVVDLQDGVGRLAPLRIRTLDGTIAGAGTLDFRDDKIDVVVASESASTGFFALDVPLHIVGPILNPHVTPALGGARIPANASADPRDMPAALRTLVRRDPCVTGGR